MKKPKIIEDIFPDIYENSLLYAVKPLTAKEAERLISLMKKISRNGKIHRNDEFKLIVAENKDIAVVVATGQNGSTAYLLIRNGENIKLNSYLFGGIIALMELAEGAVLGMGPVWSIILALFAFVPGQTLLWSYLLEKTIEKYNEIFEFFDHQ